MDHPRDGSDGTGSSTEDVRHQNHPLLDTSMDRIEGSSDLVVSLITGGGGGDTDDANNGGVGTTNVNNENNSADRNSYYDSTSSGPEVLAGVSSVASGGGEGKHGGGVGSPSSPTTRPRNLRRRHPIATGTGMVYANPPSPDDDDDTSESRPQRRHPHEVELQAGTYRAHHDGELVALDNAAAAARQRQQHNLEINPQDAEAEEAGQVDGKGGGDPNHDDESAADASSTGVVAYVAEKGGTKLLVTFILFVISGSGNAIFMKLQAIPMYNYPNFLNLFLCVLYVPVCFLYIIPMAILGYIPKEQLRLPKTPFAIMGTFDCLAGLMQAFASVYLPGPLLVLLPQAAIPISMVLSKRFLRTTYDVWQILGALTVILGILVVLEPAMSNRHAPDYLCVPLNEERDCVVCEAETTEDGCLARRSFGGGTVAGNPFLDPFLDLEPTGFVASSGVGRFGPQRVLLDEVNMATDSLSSSYSAAFSPPSEPQPICEWQRSSHANSGSASTLIWSAVMILSCVPMALSSIYKERALGRTEIDAIYLNGWVAIFQTLYSAILAVPAGLLSKPPVYPADLPRNMWEGLLCYVGRGSVTTGCRPDDLCYQSPLYVNVFLVFNFLYSNFMILVLKFGSANILFLALTMIVPIGNLAFALPFMPDPSVLHVTDVTGLAVIMSGIISYRFGSMVCSRAGWLFGATKLWRRVGSSSRASEDQEGSLTEPLIPPSSYSDANGGQRDQGTFV